MDIQVKIKKISTGSYTHGASFKSNEEAQSWVNLQVAKNPCPFGIAAHTIPPEYNEEGEIITPSVDVPADFIVEIEDVTAEVEAEAAKQAKIEAGKAAREACQAVLDYIAGCNLEKSLTIEQITTMQQTFASAEAALRAGRPTFARNFIEVIEPDGVILTEQEKSECLLLLTGY